MANQKIILVDSNGVPQAYTYTDKSGRFSFGKMALKNYKVWVDRIAVKNSAAPGIVLSSSKPNLGNLTFTLFPDHLALDVTNSIKEENAENISIKLYPVPVRDELYIASPSSENFQYTITDILGRELIHTAGYSMYQPWLPACIYYAIVI